MTSAYDRHAKSATLAVTHRTSYRYSTPVEIAQHLATIRPMHCPWQQVIAHTERIATSSAGPSVAMPSDTSSM